jgi:hypothetical protein
MAFSEIRALSPSSTSQARSGTVGLLNERRRLIHSQLVSAFLIAIRRRIKAFKASMTATRLFNSPMSWQLRKEMSKSPISANGTIIVTLQEFRYLTAEGLVINQKATDIL